MRNIRLNFMVSSEEMDLIQKKIEQMGTTNLSAYLRRMAIDGYVVHPDIDGITELTTLLRRYGTNVNQIARKANSEGHVPEQAIQLIRDQQEELWQLLKHSLGKLAAI